MADDQNGMEKTEQATPKRLADAREEGQVARSKDLNTLLLLLAAAIQPVGADVLPGKYRLEPFATSLAQPEGSALAPDGRIFVLEKVTGPRVSPMPYSMTMDLAISVALRRSFCAPVETSSKTICSAARPPSRTPIFP